MARTTNQNVNINELATLLENRFSGKKIYSSSSVLHIEATDEKMMGLIEVAKDNTSTRLDYNVLIEYPSVHNGMKFALHGNNFVCEQLAQQYGGRVSNCRYWILYNEAINDCNHGYKESLPTAESIIRFIEQLLSHKT